MSGNGSKGKKRYRLLLVHPKLKYPHYVTQNELSRLLGKEIFFFPLALPLIAAMTPDHYDIRIINEETDDLPLNFEPHIVGLSPLYPTINRAYEIADQYRSMGAKVVIGGSYVTFMAQEALRHADSVVVGEAEGAWEKLLSDFERGDLKKIYKNEKKTEFRTSPIPRWDLIDTDRIMVRGVQVSRGCPHRCEFCVATKMFGNRMRYRDIDDVIKEIEAVPSSRVFFVDDNFTTNRRYLRELMNKLKPLKMSWVCQASMEVADDEDLIRTMAETGCVSMVVGMESVNPDSLLETHKFHNRVAKFESAIAKLHAHGITVVGTFIVGFDADRLDAYDHIVEFALKNNIWFVMLSVLTAIPGTDLHDRMKKQGRILDLEPEYFNGVFPCMRFKNMSAVELFDRHFETLKKILSFDGVHKKAINLYGSGTFAKPDVGKISFVEKLFTSMLVLKRFLFTSDTTKRKLFLELFSMIREKKASPDKIIMFLLNMEGFNDWLKSTRPYIEFVREKIKMADRGPLITQE